MHLPATSLFVFVECLVFIAAAPIINIKSLDTTLHARQVVAYYDSDDSGALYQPGTGVVGTNTFRDDNGVYHDISPRTEDATEVRSRAAAVPTSSKLLWTRAQAAVIQFLTNTNSKRTVEEVQESQSMARRDEGEEDAPAGVLQKINAGEKIYF